LYTNIDKDKAGKNFQKALALLSSDLGKQVIQKKLEKLGNLS